METESRNDVFVYDRIDRFVEFYADRVEYRNEIYGKEQEQSNSGFFALGSIIVKKVCKWITAFDYEDNRVKRMCFVFNRLLLSELVRETQNGFYCLQ